MPRRALVKENVPAKQKRFLAELAKCGIIEIAAANSGIERTHHYRWMADPEYAAAYVVANREADALLEAEIRRRGMLGYKRAVWHLGKRVGEETVYSDNLLMFAAKKRMPEYRDASSTNVSMTANVQSNVKLDMTRVPQDDLEHLISTLELAGSVEAPGAVIGSSDSGEDETDEK